MQYLIYVLLVLVVSCGHKDRPVDSRYDIGVVKLLPGHTRAQHEAFASRVMIATQGKGSTEAGLEMIRRGGNAFDAAAAISFAISVERPQSTGLGGGGFMLLDGPTIKRPLAVDFREMAPSKAHRDMYIGPDGKPTKESRNGIKAGGVPGLVKGVLEVHRRFGKLPLKTVIRPAIEMAEKGIRVYPHLARASKARRPVLSKYPASAAVYLRPDGSALQVGDLLVQKDLGRTLRRILKHRERGFYDGPVAAAFAEESTRLGGPITLADMKSYKVVWRKPVEAKYNDVEIFSMSPPSSGGLHIAQILKLVEPMKLAKYGPMSHESIHLVASAMQLAFIDRARFMGDSDFVKVPMKGMLSKRYLKRLRDKIKDKALSMEQKDLVNPFGYESDETTHFTVMDKEGNVVSSTQTVNLWFGSGVVIPGTGVILNNEMDDFATAVGASNAFGAIGGKNNLIEPKKRPLSSMSPTIVRKNGRTVLALGSPAGTKILTCVASTILNYVEFKLPLYQSVAGTRYHHQWRPDKIRIDGPGPSSDVIDALKAKGHTVEKGSLGCKVQAVAWEGGKLHGVSDPRGEGLALGI